MGESDMDGILHWANSCYIIACMYLCYYNAIYDFIWLYETTSAHVYGDRLGYLCDCREFLFDYLIKLLSGLI